MRRIRLTALLLLAATVTAQAADSWIRDATTLMPEGYVAGTAWRTDVVTMTGYLAAFPAGANDPATPASAFHPGHVLVVRLARRGDALTAVAATLRPRTPGDRLQQPRAGADMPTDDVVAQFEEMNRKVAATAPSLPAGTVPCDLQAWSTDVDPKGLNVRAAPSAKARILGTLPPPYHFRAKDRSENTPEGGWLTEFHVIGYKDGWFLIEGAEPPGKAYEDERVYPRNHPRPYAGRGWVHGAKIGAQYANGQTRMGGLYQAPHTDATWMPAKGAGGDPISADGGPKRILACSGLWALVESHDGVIGWWRSLCSSQVTNCS